MLADARKTICTRFMNALALLVVTLGLFVWSSPAAAWWNDQWSLRKKITIDTGASGAGVNDPIGTMPILVRLHVGNFRFASAKEDGGDIRFIGPDDKTPLKHHVEKYDSLLGEALLWVSVPDLKPGAKSEIWLYYGNQKAPAAVDIKGTYDGDTTLVYHFAERGTPATDSSAWGNNAQTIVPTVDGAIIGQGVRFDGQVALTLPGSPSLNISEGGEFTWSAWVRMASPQPRAVLYSRKEGANGLVIGLDNGVPFVEVTSAGNTQRSGDGAPVAAGWRHIAVTAKGGQVSLFLDGNPFSTLAAALPALSGPTQIGRAAAAAASTNAPASGDAADSSTPASESSASGGFTGEFDELQIAKAAHPAGMIKVMAIGQGPDNAKLLSYSVDEEASSWSNGHFAIILQSVTLDGWIVIFFLAIMAIVSWVVMYDKTAYLNRAGKGNKLFLKRFREKATDLDGLLQVDQEESAISLGEDMAAKERKAIQSAPLYRLLHLGAHEIQQRFSNSHSPRTLSPQAIEAIRAVLDSGFVNEAQRLNRMMVMLTIAISGGPFLGLLGTVVGVMITFAAIAASGDVNVNAIAPGIAAALVATVAGLGVAIPALFAYNYFITRIKDATNEMQVFIDELITKVAESYHRLPDEPLKMAAE